MDLLASGIFMAISTSFLVVKISPIFLTISNIVYFSFLASLFLFFLWLLISWVQSFKKHTDKETSATTLKHDRDYTDDPIGRDEEDLLGRIPFVERLADQILKLPTPSSFVFSLYGSWGEGKTSVLRLLQLRLAKTDLIIVNFNPWYFADETALVQGFYYRIEQELGRIYILSRLHGTITRYKNLLTSALHYVGIQFPLKDDPERVRGELEALIQRIGRRLIIIIDDIDRLQSEEMLAVMKLARLSARLQNTVFLLSLDHLVVLETLRNSSKLEPEFLEKIIQKPVMLPPAEQRDIDRFLLFSDTPGSASHRSAIDHLLDELQVDLKRRKDFDDKIVYFYHTVARRLFKTMRHSKRYMNTLRATLPSIANEIRFYDFFLLQLLQVFFPKIYRDIWSNPWVYLPPWAQEIFLVYPFARVSSHDEKYHRIQQHIESLLQNEGQKEIAQEILKELFFEVENAFKPHGRVQHDNSAETYLAEKRLTHPKCFARYFLFRIPVGEFADELVEKLFESWKAAPNPESVASEDLRKYRETGHLAALFEKLRIFRNLVSSEQVPAIVRAVYTIAPDLSEVRNDLGETERHRAQRFLLSLIEDRADAEAIEPIIQEIVFKAKSFPFVIGIVYECGTRESGSYFRIYEKVNITSLRKFAAERLSEYYIEGHRDIFTELSAGDLALVLYQWATNWRTDIQDNRLIVQSYVINLIDHKPEYLGKLLYEFRTKYISASGERLTFDYEGFTRVFDPKVIYGSLEQHGEAAVTTPEAKEMAKIFRENFAAQESGQNKSEE